MGTYVVKRIGQSVLTLFLTLTTVFVLLRLAPGDPAAAYPLLDPRVRLTRSSTRTTTADSPVAEKAVTA